ncbi:DUF2937 family protein [Tropicibacter sp. R15_0]|uniref:DUF2937 family protein n=1 Tax=Tropicibacter sp. R15_0 TaxID=2821101 RepID=UPI001ADB86AF|nr:DUF2937 family protein [Tropicibacter sp. R15_0]MBO9466146.1 DUF2937 family protein [Tropicibacter sp. R15_0]
MIVRALTLAGGLTGAVGLSQFPEFSQQYLQRLGGAVDELGIITQQYEADAAAAGMALPDYISALSQEGALSKTQAGNMQAHLDRYSSLSAALTQLQGAGPFMRARLAANMSDHGVAKRTLDEFKPAIPATFEGAVFAGSGFLGGWLGLKLVFAFLAGLWGSATSLFRRPA